MSETITNGVKVQVSARFLEERSNPHTNKFVFAYTVTITNTESVPVQLMSRKWIIKDADGDIETVEGPGVVGEKPVLQPGQSFEYTSFCPLKTNVGTMHGTYTMSTPGGQVFQARIAPFTLAVPNALN